MLARLFVIFGGLFVLALCAALIGPYFVDWTSYRADFEREASRILGRQVTVEGEASARILPFPSVTFSDVVVAGADGRPAMTAERFSMDAELAPFLRGDVLIFDMRLERPKATLRIGADGGVDWAMRADATFDPGHVTIENLTVSEGQVTIEHAPSGRVHKLTEVNTTLSARTLAGPWRMGGSMRLDGALTDFDLSTGQASDDGIRLRLRAAPQRYPFAVETDGMARLRDGAPVYAGSFKLTANEAAPRLRGSDGETFDIASERPQVADYRMSGAFELDHARLAATEFRFETGPPDNPYTADGTAELAFGGEPRFAVTATGAQFRFDERLGEEGAAAATLDSRVAAVKEFVLALPKPTIPGKVAVNLPAVVAGDTTFRDVRLAAEPGAGGWTVADFAVSMPGRATLEASGVVSTAADDVRFDGDMVLAVGQPSGFAAWLSRDVDDAIRRLPAAGFSARAQLSSEAQRLDDLELRLGGATFHGHLEHLTPADARPALLLKLDGGALDVEGLTAFASLFVSEAGRSRMRGRDLDLAVTAGPVSAIGLAAGKVDAALRLKDGRLDIDRLAVSDLAGTNVSATGKITGFPEAPLGSLDATIVSDDLAPLAAVLGERYPDSRLAAGLAQRFAAYPGLGEDARIDVTATAAGEAATRRLALSAGGTAGGSELTLAWTATGAPLAPDRVELDFSARNDDGAALFALYGLPAIPFGTVGPADTSLRLSGAPADGLRSEFRLTGETARAGFDGTVALAGDGIAATGKASLGGADIEPWLTSAGIVLPGTGFGLPADLKTAVALTGAGLKLDGLSGSVGGQAVSATLLATLKDGRPHLAGQVETSYFPLDLAAALVLGDGSFEATGAGWPEQAFPARVTAPLSAELKVKAREVATAAGPLATEATFGLRFDNDRIAFSEVSAGLAGGRVAGLFELKNDAGTGAFSGQLTLTDADLAGLRAMQALSGRGDFSASLTASGKSAGAMMAALAGTGTAALRDLTIDGFNPDALAALIAAADTAGSPVDAAAVDGFAGPIVGTGRLAVGDADVAFTVAGGVLRTPPLTLQGEGARLTADLRADLGQRDIAVSGELAYEAGAEALVGSEPAVRFVAEGAPGEMARAFDMQPMAQFLTQRALEIEQARVEAMQAQLMEKQRLRREARYYAALQDARRQAEEERLRLEEEARLQAEEEARLKAEEAARARAEADAAAEAAARAEAERRRAGEAQQQQLRNDSRPAPADGAALRAAQDAQAAAEAEQRAADEASRRQQDGFVDMAGRRPAAPDTPSPVQPAVPATPAPEAGGFTINNLLKSLGADD